MYTLFVYQGSKHCTNIDYTSYTNTHTDIQVSCIPLEICSWHFITLGLSPVSFDVLSLAESVSEGEAN